MQQNHFVEYLRENYEKKARMTISQLKLLAASLDSEENFDEILEGLNESGYLLKKPGNLYEFHF